MRLLRERRYLFVGEVPFGAVFSTTVSSVGRGPLGPLTGVLAAGGGCSWKVSSLAPSAGGAAFSDGVDEGWTTMAGGFALLCDREEFLRGRPAMGGGDLIRGEGGKVGVESPEVTAEARCDLASLDTASVTELGEGRGCGCCSWGMLAADRARWMAAADGAEVGVVRAGVRCGLVSWLLWRGLKRPALAWTPAGGVLLWRMDGRTGEGLREERGLSGRETFGLKVAEGCFRRVGMDDSEADEACRTVTGLLSLLDAEAGAGGGGGRGCGGASLASAMAQRVLVSFVSLFFPFFFSARVDLSRFPCRF